MKGWDIGRLAHFVHRGLRGFWVRRKKNEKLKNFLWNAKGIIYQLIIQLIAQKSVFGK